MSAMSVSWLVVGVSLCAVLVLAILLWLQWLQCRHCNKELDVLRDVLGRLGGVIQRLEQENIELAAGLRAEKR